MISIWPSLVWLGITILGLGLQWGENKLSFASVAATVFMVAILYWGSFFDPLLRIASN